MNRKKLAIGGAIVLGAALFATVGAVGGYAAAEQQAAAEDREPGVPCNLRLVWDRVTERSLAVYEDSALISYTPNYGRIANLSCSDDVILQWQEARRVDGLDDQVCRPVVRFDADATAEVVGCAVPSLVVDRESR